MLEQKETTQKELEKASADAKKASDDWKEELDRVDDLGEQEAE